MKIILTLELTLSDEDGEQVLGLIRLTGIGGQLAGLPIRIISFGVKTDSASKPYNEDG